MPTAPAEKAALVIGVNSQDGFYLCHLLMKKDYIIYGTTRSEESEQPPAEILSYGKFKLLHLDLLQTHSVESCIAHVMASPHSLVEVYCLAAVSQVRKSVTHPIESADSNALGPLRILHFLTRSNLASRTRFLFASSSEIFGSPDSCPQDENTLCSPVSPYGMAKLFVTQQVRFQREFHDAFASCAILYNHESHRRPVNFVTRKVTSSAVAISRDLLESMEIGNLDARRDWGHAEDYVRGMWMILQQETGGDYIISSGELHSVRTLVTLAFDFAGISLRWDGAGLDEVGIDKISGVIRVKVNPHFYRPEDKKVTELTKIAEPAFLLGDNSKLKKIGWNKVHEFKDVIQDMIRHDSFLSNEALKCALHLDEGVGRP